MSAKEAYENDCLDDDAARAGLGSRVLLRSIRTPQAHPGSKKIYQGLGTVRWRVRSKMRAQMAQIHAQEADRRLQKYAVDGFSRFVFFRFRRFRTRPLWRKRSRSMRRNGVFAGFR